MIFLITSQASLRDMLLQYFNLTRDSPCAHERTSTLRAYGESRVKSKYLEDYDAETRLRNIGVSDVIHIS